MTAVAAVQRARVALVAWCVAGAGGWRHGGDGVAEGATLPASWSTPAWSVSTPNGSNASPVALDAPGGPLVCSLSEPVEVWCVDAATGARRWSATNHYLDTLPAADRATWSAMLAEIPTLQACVSEAQQDMSRLRREARGGNAEAAAGLSDASARLDRCKDKLDALNVFATPGDQDILGYTSPTPAADGADLYVMTGNGVLSRFTATGARVWSMWLGPSVRPMAGFEVGSATSPQLVDGLVIAGHRALTAVDARTGAVRWRDDALWNHYGAPGVGRVGGVSVLALPDGRVLRASDGHVLLTLPTQQLYTGPQVHGDVVVFAGTEAKNWQPARHRVAAFRVAPGTPWTASLLYNVDLPVQERVYTASLWHDGLLTVLTQTNDLWVGDALTGATACTRRLDAAGAGIAYGAPTLVGDAVVVGAENGVMHALRPGRGCEVLRTITLGETNRSTPLFLGQRAYVRTRARLAAFGPG